MIVYRHTYRVRGSGAFPVDMLRYDGSHPRREEDSGTIEARSPSAGAMLPGTSIGLERWAERTWRPCADRWRSFGWEVVEDSHQSSRIG